MMQCADFFDVIQSQSKAIDFIAFNARNAIEFVKDKIQFFCWNTDAIVDKFKFQCRFFDRNPDGNCRNCIAVFNGIVKQIVDQICKMKFVGIDYIIFGSFNTDGDIFVLKFYILNHVFNDGDHADHFLFECQWRIIRLCDIQDLLNMVVEFVALGYDDVGVFF